ncbi:MAG: RNA polymerase sigma-70 factor [Bacteroidales bacterium]|nr:RNA polymerase sigma-70 factor [Bacteroidales bacterium]
MTEKEEEVILVKGLKNGDEAAFNELFKNYRVRLHRFVVSIVKLESEAEDIVQQVFLNVWLKRETIDTEKSFSAFLYTIAKNRSLNTLRSSHTNNQFLKDQIWHSIELSRCFTDEKIEYDELLKQVSESLAKLTPQQRKIFEMSRKEGLSHEEIGKELRISKNTVRNHISEAIKQIKKEIELNSDASSVISILLLWFFS